MSDPAVDPIRFTKVTPRDSFHKLIKRLMSRGSTPVVRATLATLLTHLSVKKEALVVLLLELSVKLSLRSSKRMLASPFRQVE